MNIKRLLKLPVIPTGTEGLTKYFTALHGALTQNQKEVYDTLQPDLINALSSATAAVPSTLVVTASSPLAGGGALTTNRTFSIPKATAATNGYLGSGDWIAFNSKVDPTITITASSPLTGGGDLSTNRTIAIPVANTTADGYLSSSDWVTFNTKQAPLGFTPVANTIVVTGSAPIVGGGALTGNVTLSMAAATSGTDGYLTGAKFQEFDTKVSSALIVTGSAPIVGGGALTGNITLSMAAAASGTDGYLSGANFQVFNTKVSPTLVVTGSAPIVGGGALTGNVTLSMAKATSGTDGYLAGVDWNTFNGKIGTTSLTILGSTVDGCLAISAVTTFSIAQVAVTGDTFPVIRIGRSGASTKANVFGGFGLGNSGDVQIQYYGASGEEATNIVGIVGSSVGTYETGLYLYAGRIQFPAAQAPSTNANVLDDYEEGTWTPALGCDIGTITSQTNVSQLGAYLKIGRYAYCSFVLSVTNIVGGSGQAWITGMPFAAHSAFTQGGTIYYSNQMASGTQNGSSFWLNPTANYVYIIGNSAADARSFLSRIITMTNIGGSFNIRGQICYITTS